MKCSEVSEILDRMIFEEVTADAAFSEHLETCPMCTRAYANALEARQVMNLLRRSEPLLSDPGGLTGNIMAAVGKDKVKTPVVPLLLVRLLAAASLALFLVFGYEQYGIVTNISALEKQCAAVKPGSRYPELRRLASAFDISEAGFPFPGVERLLRMEKRKTLFSNAITSIQTDKKYKK